MYASTRFVLTLPPTPPPDGFRQGSRAFASFQGQGAAEGVCRRDGRAGRGREAGEGRATKRGTINFGRN